jgi:L-aspartate oxidase
MGEQHPRHHRYDVVVIGSGAAGLALALRLPRHQRIAVLSKGDVTQSSTYWAQGGMAAVLHARDSVEAHVEDTLAAGRACAIAMPWSSPYPAAARPSTGWSNWAWTSTCARTSTRARVPSTTSPRRGGTATGASSTPRTARAARSAMCCRRAPAQPATSTCCRDASPSTSWSPTAAAAVSTCWTERDTVDLFEAGAVVLASGGASKAYLYTTNPDGASGDGIAMAWRAGCRVANMEFNQFHPTCLYHPQAKSFLITEALRGEGARCACRTASASCRASTSAPSWLRATSCARAIDHEMKRLGLDCVFLDISHRDPDFIRAALPDHPRALPELGIDITRSRSPWYRRRTTPAAAWSSTSTAAPTCPGCTPSASAPSPACTAPTAWPATRCSSAWSTRQAAADIAAADASNPAPADLPPWDESQVTDSDEDVVISHNWDELRRFMWDYVGIVRTDKRLQRALHRVELLQGRSPSTTATTRSAATCSSCATWPRSRS